MLTRLHVEGFKALRDISLTFEPLTVIVGPNGCGKTSVLEAIAMTRDFATAPRDRVQALYAFDEIASRAVVGPIAISTDLRYGFDDRAREIIRKNERVPFSDFSAHLMANERYDEIGLELNYRSTFPDYEAKVRVHPDHRSQTSGLLTDCFGAIRRLKPNIDVLASPSYLPEAEPWIRDDGRGLATVLNWLLGERDERFTTIEEYLREFVPEVRRIRTQRVPMRVVEPVDVKIGTDEHGRDVFEKRSYKQDKTGHQVVIDFEHAGGVPASHASEGTLLLLGLLTTVVTSNASVLLLDDIERGLHPKTQQQLVGYLKKMTAEGTQVIATSHSPYLLLHLDYDEVRAMTLAGAEGSRIGKLTEHPEFDEWKQEMSPSEFWTVFGESWLQERKAGG